MYIYIMRVLFEFLFVMLNQKIDFGFCETFIYNKSDVIFPFYNL